MPATFRMLREFDPEAKAILSSGDGAGDAKIEDIVHDVQAVLPKPFTIQDLLKTLRDVLDRAL